MVRKAAVLGPAYLIGLLLASFFASGPSLLMGGLFLCLGVCVMTVMRPDKGGRLFAAAAAAVSLSAGIFLYCGYDGLVYGRITADSGKSFSGRVTVREVTVYSSDSAFCTGICTLPCGKRAKIGWYSDETDIVRGDTVNLSGTLYIPSSPFYGRSDYYRSKGVFLFLKVKDSGEIYRVKGFFRAAEELRGRTAARIKRYVPSDEGELMTGMIFGSRYCNISRKAEQSLYRAGIGHIASVSGMHMALAAGMVSALSAGLTLSRRTRAVIITAVCTAFAAAAGFGAPVVRSLIMIVIVYAADMFLRQSDPLSSLCIAAFMMTVTSPFTVRDSSFMLSFSGVFGAAVAAPAVMEAIKAEYVKRRGTEPENSALLYAAVTAVCASMAVLPASAVCFDEISAAAPLSNLLLSPVYSAAITVSMAGTVCSLLPFEWLWGGLFLSGGILCKAVLWAAGLIGSAPWLAFPAGLDIVPPMTGLAIAAAVLSALFVKDRMNAVCLICGAIAVCTVSAAVYRSVPSGAAEISLLTDGKGGILVIRRDGVSDIFDFSGSRSGARAAVSLAARKDAAFTELVCAEKKSGSETALYQELCPYAKIISPEAESGLTYEAERTIIKADGLCFYPYDGYSVIETRGIRILRVDKPCSLPAERFELCVYNCPWPEDMSPADADFYAVTDSRFEGLLPAGAPCAMSGGEYRAINGSLTERKEDGKWLR